MRTFRFSDRRQRIEEDRVQDVRDDLAEIVSNLDALLAHESNRERQEDAETRRCIVAALQTFGRKY